MRILITLAIATAMTLAGCGGGGSKPSVQSSMDTRDAAAAQANAELMQAQADLRAAREALEETRLEAEREADRLEAERLEEARRAEEARLEAERLEDERLAEEARRLEAERLEAARIEEARRLEGPAFLETVGTAQQTGTSAYSETRAGGRFPGTFTGQRPYYSFDNWGLRADVGGETLFRADIRRETSASSLSEHTLHIEGGKSLFSPIGGSAVWTGGVRAYDAHPTTFGTPVTGTARLQVNFSAATVDVDFTGFSGGHTNMSWNDLRMIDGSFSARSAYTSINGAFYGAQHQGVAGSFSRDRLNGVFGALRPVVRYADP